MAAGSRIVVTCPKCNGRAVRIRRRAIDRCVSLVYPIKRYRCSSYCGWKGNIASPRDRWAALRRLTDRILATESGATARAMVQRAKDLLIRIDRALAHPVQDDNPLGRGEVDTKH